MTEPTKVIWPALALPPINLWSVPRQINATPKDTMATLIKKTVQFQAPDGTFHASQKLAAEHVTNQAVKAELTKFVDTGVVPFNDDANGYVVTQDDMVDFLFKNREDILAALQPKVEIRQRKTRAPNAKKPASPAGGEQNLAAQG